MALLEDKCLMLFRNYIEENYSKYFTWSDWLSGKITDSMKWGVYQEFFYYEYNIELCIHVPTKEARTAAIEQADKLVNQRKC